MKIQDLIEELESTSHFKTFQKEHSDTFFAAAFLILDLPQNSAICGYAERRKNKTEQIQLDYFIPSTSQIAAFSHPFTEPKIHDDIISVQKGETAPKKIESMNPQTTKIKIDIDDLEPKCKELINENNSLIIPTKIIAILKDNQWNLTLMDDMLGIVRIKIDPISKELLDFNKGSLMNFMGIKKK